MDGNIVIGTIKHFLLLITYKRYNKKKEETENNYERLEKKDILIFYVPLMSNKYKSK